jgi:hypothetical protein
VVIMVAMGHHPAPTGSRQNKARMRERARRGDALEALEVAQATIAYAAGVLANGAGQARARRAAFECAQELSVLAGQLRAWTRPSAAERAAQARELAAAGYGTQEIATRLGVSVHTAWNYKKGRRGDGQPWA